jgi:hypothetical protein
MIAIQSRKAFAVNIREQARSLPARVGEACGINLFLLTRRCNRGAELSGR